MCILTHSDSAADVYRNSYPDVVKHLIFDCIIHIEYTFIMLLRNLIVYALLIKVQIVLK